MISLLFSVIIIVQLSNVQLIPLNDYRCGIKLKTSADAIATEANEWPWMVSLFFMPSNTFICGGTIVSEHHVLTAAHCVSKKKRNNVLDPSELQVYLGKHNLSAIEEDSEWFHPHEILVHPDWEDGDKQFDADLAILVSAFAIPFSDKISPVCLWTDVGEDEDNIGTVVGWGEIKNAKSEGRSDVPHQIQVQRVPSARCYEDFHLIASIASSRTFCAGGVVKDFSPCTGDSGGGFFIEQNGVWFIQGIVSATFLSKTKRCDVSKYALYTKINEFLSWINLKNREYKVSAQCNYLSEIRKTQPKEKLVSLCRVFGMSVIQPSGSLEISKRKSSISVESMQITFQDTVYLPNGIGDFFKNLTYLLIFDSRLKFVERSNFENLENLKILDIKSNPITHVPKDALTPLINLQDLAISSCKLTKLHRDMLRNNLELKFLNISNNQLDSLPPELFKNNLKLEALISSNNRIKFIDDQIFSNLRNMKFIEFNENMIQKISKNAFSDLTNLRVIRLIVNRLKSLHVDTFVNNVALATLHIHTNQIDEFKQGLFRNNSRLNIIRIDNNKVKVIHNGFIDNLINLKRISMSGMSITQLPFDLFFTLKKYEIFSIDDNYLKTLHKDLLSKNLNLIYFGASYNRIEGLDSTFFRNNLKLREIYLTHNRIRTIDDGLFKSLANVVKIVLSFNYINSIADNAFAFTHKLKELHLQGNNLQTLSQDLFIHNPLLTTRLEDVKKILPFPGEIYKEKNFTNTDFFDEIFMKIDHNKCGLKLNASGLIVNGKATEVNEWPWLSSLLKSETKEFFCGASIVSEHHVLTAAHCVSDKRKKTRLAPREVLVYLGKHNLSIFEENSQWFLPIEIRIHPDWEADENRWDADLAILVSDVAIPFSSTIMPICLWTNLEEENNLNGFVVGWGGSEKTNRQGHTDIPYQVEVRRIPSAKCYEDFYKIAKVASSRTFCASGVVENSGPCNGDSGGGFFVEDNGVWYLQGIVSSSMVSQVHDCDVSKHALYTKINEFLSWINLKNKAYNVEIRGKVLATYNEITNEKVSIYQCKSLSITQPSGVLVLKRDLEWRVDIFEMANLRVVYFPNGVGRIFVGLRVLEVFQSNLRFIERENFKDLENLEALRLHSNPISFIPSDAFLDLKNLHALRISESNIVYLHRNLLVNNPRLKHLFLNSNQIETLPFDFFRNNLELTVIDLHRNRMKMIGQVFSNLVNLEWIYLSENIIQHIAPDAFHDLRSLKGINLQRNRLKTLNVDNFVGNRELLNLWIGHNHMTELPRGLLKNNFKLKEFQFSSNKVNNISDSIFENLENLKLVQLNAMNLKYLPLGIFSSLISLEQLKIEYNSLTILHKDLLSMNLNLTSFFASFNNLAVLDASIFRNNQNLETISLSYNKLTEINVGLFKNLRNVKNLLLEFNMIKNIEVNSFSDLTKLELLNLKDNKISTLDENLFAHVINLEILNMDSNQIEHLPSGLFEKNSKLSTIQFNFNQIQTVDIIFDIKRNNYKELDFFANVCINKLGIDGTQAALIDEIRQNCSSKKLDV